MSEGERIRVMVVDDHSIMRFGLKLVLEQSGEFEVVGQAADGEEAVRVAAEVSPDVVVMDVIMPNKDGVEACREIIVGPRYPGGDVDRLDGGVRRGGRSGGRRHGVSPEGDGPGAAAGNGARRVPWGAFRARCGGEESVLGDTQRMEGRSSRRRRADSKGAGDTRRLRPGHVLRADSRGQGGQKWRGDRRK